VQRAPELQGGTPRKAPELEAPRKALELEALPPAQEGLVARMLETEFSYLASTSFLVCYFDLRSSRLGSSRRALEFEAVSLRRALEFEAVALRRALELESIPPASAE